MDDAGYIFAAFAAVWAVLFAFVLMLRQHQNKLQKELESLEGEICKVGVDQ